MPFKETRLQTFDYELDTGIEINLPIDNDLIATYKTAPREYSYQGSRPPKNWEVAFYNMFIEREDDAEVIEYLVYQLKKIAEQRRQTDLEMAVNYVQGAIGYDMPKAMRSTNRQVQYPYETAFLGKGVCSDKTILLAKILLAMDYKVAFFEFPKANHIALGVSVPSGYGNFGTNFCFIETTDYTPLGEIPENYIQGIKLTEAPFLFFPNDNGVRIFRSIIDYKRQLKEVAEKYGEGYLLGNATQKQLSIEMSEMQEDLKNLRADHKAQRCAEETRKTSEEFLACQALTEKINEKVKRYNQLVEQYNKLNKN